MIGYVVVRGVYLIENPRQKQNVIAHHLFHSIEFGFAAAQGFYRAAAGFCVQAASFGRQGGFCGAALAGDVGGSPDHLGKPRECIVAVERLGAVPVGKQHYDAFLGRARTGKRYEAGSDGFRQGRAIERIEAQLHRRSDLVDVLAAGA